MVGLVVGSGTLESGAVRWSGATSGQDGRRFRSCPGACQRPARAPMSGTSEQACDVRPIRSPSGDPSVTVSGPVLSNLSGGGGGGGPLGLLGAQMKWLELRDAGLEPVAISHHITM